MSQAPIYSENVHFSTLLSSDSVRLRLLETAVAGSTSGITIADATTPNMPLVYANQSFYDITGYTPAEVIGHNCRFLQGEDRDQTEVQTLRVAVQQEQQCRVELRNYRKDGTLFWNELLLYPLHDTTGRLTHYVGVQNDITERKIMEQRIRESEERYRMVSQLTTDYVYSFQVLPDGSLYSEWVAGSLEAICGYDREELNSLGGWAILLHPDDMPTAQKRFAKIMSGQDDISNFRIITKQGDIRWLRDYGRPILDNTNTVTHIIGAAQDITEQQAARESLLEAEKLRIDIAKEREMIALRERFMATVSHDFRTPFSVINMNAGLIEANVVAALPPNKAAKVSRYINRIQSQVVTMTSLLDDVLRYSRAQAGKINVQMNMLNLHNVCLDSIDQIKATDLAGHRINFQFLCPQLAYCADENIMQHVLMNLLSNALKYSPEHSEVLFVVSADNDHLTFKIKDHGIGIPLEDQTHLFEPFFRAGNVNRVQGTGLGLAIVKQNVEAHGGTIDYESIPEQGSTFIVKLPIITI